MTHCSGESQRPTTPRLEWAPLESGLQWVLQGPQQKKPPPQASPPRVARPRCAVAVSMHHLRAPAGIHVNVYALRFRESAAAILCRPVSKALPSDGSAHCPPGMRLL